MVLTVVPAAQFIDSLPVNICGEGPACQAAGMFAHIVQLPEQPATRHHGMRTQQRFRGVGTHFGGYHAFEVGFQSDVVDGYEFPLVGYDA